MANPYSGAGTAAGALANARGDAGDKTTDALDRAEASLPLRLIIKRIFQEIGSRMPLLILALVLDTISVMLQLYVPILIGDGIDALVGVGQVRMERLVGVCQAMALAVIVAAMSQWAAGYTLSRLTNELVRDLRVQAYEKLNRLPLSFVDGHAHGDLLARISSDADQVGDGLLQALTQFLTGVVTIVGTLAFMCSIAVPVALVIMVATPLSIVAAMLVTRASTSSFAQQQELAGALAGYVEEHVGNQRLVMALGYGGSAAAGFAVRNERLRGVGEHAQFVSSLSNPSTRLVNNLIYALVAAVGCLCVITGVPATLSVGQVQSFLSYANQYMKPFNEISAVVGQVQAALASARRLLALLDAEEEPLDPPDAITPRNVHGALDFDHVSFAYDESQPLLEDITFHAKPSQRIALVGPTGCGKTTLINLLLRFYGVREGTIRVDGIDVRRMSRAGLRSCFGMVLQETWLFEGSVHDNIAYGRDGATREEVEAAARRAHVDGFIRQLPNGYDTIVGEGGGSLSQGQRQLLCIARVMLADPPILLLDEATSSIDTRTELQVQAAFDDMMAQRTSLVVAHRLSTVRNSDCILVLKDGRIIERGTHEELRALGGFYAELYQSQFAQAPSSGTHGNVAGISGHDDHPALQPT